MTNAGSPHVSSLHFNRHWIATTRHGTEGEPSWRAKERYDVSDNALKSRQIVRALDRRSQPKTAPNQVFSGHLAMGSGRFWTVFRGFGEPETVEGLVSVRHLAR